MVTIMEVQAAAVVIRLAVLPVIQPVEVRPSWLAGEAVTPRQGGARHQEVAPHQVVQVIQIIQQTRDMVLALLMVMMVQYIIRGS